MIIVSNQADRMCPQKGENLILSSGAKRPREERGIFDCPRTWGRGSGEPRESERHGEIR